MIAVIWPDALRFSAIVLGCMSAALFPGTVVHRVHGWRSYLAALVILLLFLSLITGTWQHLGNAHLRWYRSPVLLFCSVLAMIYVVSVRGWRIWQDPR